MERIDPANVPTAPPLWEGEVVTSARAATLKAGQTHQKPKSHQWGKTPKTNLSKAEASGTRGTRKEYESTPTLPHVVHTVRKVKAAITKTAGGLVVAIAGRLPRQNVAGP